MPAVAGVGTGSAEKPTPRPVTAGLAAADTGEVADDAEELARATVVDVETTGTAALAAVRVPATAAKLLAADGGTVVCETVAFAAA
jgi:hypothetical protein